MKNNPEVVMIGLGYIGLPTAALIAENGTYVHGVDINQNVVDTINRGEIHILEPSLEQAVSNAVSKGFLKASTIPVAADTYLIVVPTPFKDKNEPDISFVLAATKAILPLLKPGDTYIIESTSPVGTTEKMMNYIYKERPNLHNKLHIAYCPERVLPGNVMYELVHNDRVIGGVYQTSTSKGVAFYSKYVQGKLICDKADINVWELIQLANKHPRVNILQPGCGVGGHCIAVDPYFIVADYPMESKIIGTAREVNNYKSFWCAEKVQRVKLEFELVNGKKPKIALMGLAFKPDIDDLRESPAKYIAQRVLQNSNNEDYYIVEPNIEEHNIFKLTNVNEAFEKADIVVFLVAHKEFKNLANNDNKVILDFAGVLNIKS